MIPGGPDSNRLRRLRQPLLHASKPLGMISSGGCPRSDSGAVGPSISLLPVWVTPSFELSEESLTAVDEFFSATEVRFSARRTVDVSLESSPHGFDHEDGCSEKPSSGRGKDMATRIYVRVSSLKQREASQLPDLK